MEREMPTQPESLRRREFSRELDFARKHLPEFQRVIRQVAGALVHVWEAPQGIDRDEGIDLFATVPSGEIACRVRRASNTHARDLTIRRSVPSGWITELEKVRTGCIRWYLYGWAENRHFVDWMFVDLNAVRRRNLIDTAIRNNQIRYNRDRSSFVFVTSLDLIANGCLIAATFGPERLRWAS